MSGWYSTDPPYSEAALLGGLMASATSLSHLILMLGWYRSSTGVALPFSDLKGVKTWVGGSFAILSGGGGGGGPHWRLSLGLPVSPLMIVADLLAGSAVSDSDPYLRRGLNVDGSKIAVEPRGGGW